MKLRTTTNDRLFSRAFSLCVLAPALLFGPISILPAEDAPTQLSTCSAAVPLSRQVRIPVTPECYLPRLRSVEPCDPIPGETYPETWINSPPTDRPAADHPDLNLRLRGFTSVNAERDLVFYYGDTDKGAPQFSGLFGDDRMGVIGSVYRVHDWDWGEFQPGKTISDPEVTLIGLKTTPGEVIYLPPSGYTIGEGFDALVLYADPSRLTIKYSREDNVVGGYTLHLENVCPAPGLLAVYENCNNNARGHLPALYAGHALGRARGNEVGVAIRDNGDFMDPRSSKDWWVR